MNLDNKVIGEMGVEGVDKEKDTLDIKHDKQNFTAAVHMQNNDAGGPSELGNNDEMFLVSRDDCMEENFMVSEDTKDLEAVTDAINVSDYTNTEKEELLLPNKKVCEGKKVVKKRKLVKRKVIIIKDEEKSKPSDRPDPSVEARKNEDGKIEENLSGTTMTDSLLDKQTFAASVDMQNDVAGLACQVGDDEIFRVCKDDIIDGIIIGSENPKDLEALTDAITLNDDLNTSKEVPLLPEKNPLKKKKVVKKRKLVKGKVIVAKDEEKLKQSNPAEETMNDSLIDKQELVASADAQNDETRLASDVGDDEMFLVPEDDIREESVMGSEDAKNLKSRTDAITKSEKGREKEKIRDDDTSSTKEMLLSGKKVLKRKKVVKKRIIVKGKAAVGKSQEKPQTSDMPNMKEAAKSQSKAKLTKNVAHEATAEDIDGAEPSTKHNSLNKVETMGMIFMCSSKTKEDCYRYKIMGLPANKKDAVLKVYKGMRLFLFDFELKLLYGIYKAVGPGGYNIEPDAFKSNFPSQVRFTAVRDCSPLPEEKFRNIIKDNYYTKFKFNSELNSEQVKSLCKLFQLTNKGPKSKAKVVTERPKARVRSIVERQKKRRERNEKDERGRERRAEADSGRDNKRRRVAGNLRGSRDKRNMTRPRGGDDSRRTRLEDDSRRTRLEDDARRRARFEDDARRLRMDDEERRVRADEDARRLRFEDEARRLQVETEERRIRMEGDARRRRAEDRRHSPLGLNDDRFLRRADVVFEREAYLPTVLDGLPPPVLPPYASSSYTTLHSDYRLLGAAAAQSEDRGGLAYSRPTRLLYDYETSYLPQREPIVYRDPGYDASTARSYYPEQLPPPSRTSRYHLSPYRRY